MACSSGPSSYIVHWRIWSGQIQFARRAWRIGLRWWNSCPHMQWRDGDRYQSVLVVPYLSIAQVVNTHAFAFGTAPTPQHHVPASGTGHHLELLARF
jgi:hypothetical protein